MAFLNTIINKVKKIRTPQGGSVNTQPIDDGHSLGLTMEIFGAFQAYMSPLALSSYRDVEIKNPKISASFRTRRYKTLSYGWKVEPSSSEEIDKEIADFVKYVLENIEEQTFEQSLRWLMYALRDEYAVLHILPKLFKSGPWAGKAGLSWLMPVNRFSIEPKLEFKRLVALKINSKEYPAEDFVVYSHEPTDTKPMGSSLFDALLWYNWFFKNGMKFWSAYLDRFGMGIAIAKVPAGASDADKELIKVAIRDINAGYSIRIPQGADIEILKAMGSGKTGFERYVNFCGEMVTEILLGQTLSTGVGEFASRAQATVHAETLNEYNKVDAQEISGAINRQLIPRLIEWNYGAGRECPTFKIITEAPKDQDKEVSRAVKALEKGLVLKEEEAYSAFDFTVPEAGDKVVSYQITPVNNPLPPKDKDKDKDKENKEESDEFAESNLDPETKQALKDTDDIVEKYAENFKKASAKLPELIMTVIDRASRGLPQETIDPKKKK
jgi:phage gp29-like protein